MTHEFDKDYWERHWRAAAEPDRDLPVNPYLAAETAGLPVGTALDAGCGTGNEALWLADRGWLVTGADIAATALDAAARKADSAGLSERLEWVEADVTAWAPGRTWDLVVTAYAHPSAGQLAFYERIGEAVGSGGTLLIVGHLHEPGRGHGAGQDHKPGHGHEPGHGAEDGHPAEATADLAGITELFGAPRWQLETGYEAARTVHSGGRAVHLRDVVVRARRTT